MVGFGVSVVILFWVPKNDCGGPPEVLRAVLQVETLSEQIGDVIPKDWLQLLED